MTFIIASLVNTAEIGYAPPDIAFPRIKISAFTSGVPLQCLSEQAQFPQVAKSLPVLAMPVCTSSAIKSTLYFLQSALAAAK